MCLYIIVYYFFFFNYKKTVFAGPSALNPYRNFKLEQLIRENYEFFVSDALELKLEKEERGK